MKSQTTKENLRLKVKLRRTSMLKEEAARISDIIAEKLFKMDEFTSAKTLSSYVAKTQMNEVHTEKVIRYALKCGKKVLIPITNRIEKRIYFSELRNFDLELTQGTFGILEPKKEFLRVVDNPYETDLVLVPGIAFDENGNRIGFGKGYFDKFLEGIKNTAIIGLAYDFQTIQSIPASEYDVPVDIVLTEKRILYRKS